MTTPASDNSLAIARTVGLQPLCEGLWIDQGPQQFLGLQLGSTMAVVRLPDAGLLLWSPLPCTAARRAAVDALGTVTHLVAPNLMHHLAIGDWATAYPQAKLHAAPGLPRKRPDLRVDRELGSAVELDFGDALRERAVDGCRLHETAFYHAPSGTILLTDLVHNIGRPTHLWTATYARVMGFYDTVALSRMLRWTAFSDRRAARRSVDAMLDWPLQRAVLGHGTPLLGEVAAALRTAWAFLPGEAAALPRGAAR
ncbi:MAG: DUF4336 domain-containing protein [Deltaproteobacteria bacterium]|nr:DUF4336 domain-containing protein [Deltaproteobacteria bacterium]